MSGAIEGSDMLAAPWLYRCTAANCGYSWLRPAHLAKPREHCAACGADVRGAPREEDNK